MESNQYFSEIPNSDTNNKSPITYLKKILDYQGILNQLIFESVQTTWTFLHSRRFQYRVTDGRFVAFGIGESKNEAKEMAAKSLLRVILKDYPELCSKNSKGFRNIHTSDSNVTYNSEELLNADECKTIGFRSQEREHNSIELLHELCEYFNLPSPVYILESSEGPLHSKVHTISSRVLIHVVNGIGTTRNMAKRNAADKLYLMLKNMPAKYLQNLRNRRNHQNQNNKVAENTNAVGFVRRKFSRMKKNFIQKPVTQKTKVNSVYRDPDNIINLNTNFTSNRVDKQNQVTENIDLDLRKSGNRVPKEFIKNSVHQNDFVNCINQTKDLRKNLVNQNSQVSEHNDMAISDCQKINNFINISECITKYPANQVNEVTENDIVNFVHQETSNFISMTKDFTQNPIEQQKYIARNTHLIDWVRQDYFPFSNSRYLKNSKYITQFILITSIPRTLPLAEEHFLRLMREMLIRFNCYETNPILNCVCGQQGLKIILTNLNKHHEPTFQISTYNPINISTESINGIEEAQLDDVHKIMEYFNWFINNRKNNLMFNVSFQKVN